MVAIKRSAGVAPEMNLRNLLHQVRKHTSEGIHPGFETQGRHHQKSKTGVSVGPPKGLVPYIFFFKNQKSFRKETQIIQKKKLSSNCHS